MTRHYQRMLKDSHILNDFSPNFIGIQLHSDDCTRISSAQELRFKTYCLERKYLAPEKYVDQKEYDEYDCNSEHFGAFDRDHKLVGYVRLVHSDRSGYFPFQHYGLKLFSGFVLPPPKESGEISRLIVSQHYRRRREDRIIPGDQNATECSEIKVPDRRIHSPQILLNLYRQMYAVSKKNGVRYWYAAMDKTLTRALNHMNFGFQQIGPDADYYGVVSPYILDLENIEERLGQENMQLLNWFRDSMYD